MRLQSELEGLFGRRVDIVEKSAVEDSPNVFRRAEILSHYRVIHASAV
jgi:predicted nucleotidyltransferase